MSIESQHIIYTKVKKMDLVNIDQGAKALGYTRQTVYNRMKYKPLPKHQAESGRVKLYSLKAFTKWFHSAV